MSVSTVVSLPRPEPVARLLSGAAHWAEEVAHHLAVTRREIVAEERRPGGPVCRTLRDLQRHEAALAAQLAEVER